MKIDKILKMSVVIMFVIATMGIVTAAEETVDTEIAGAEKSNIEIADVETVDVGTTEAVSPVKFYTDKNSYKQSPLQVVTLTLQNMGNPIWIPNFKREPWKLTNVRTGKVVDLPKRSCPTFGYGSSCKPDFTKLTKGQKISQKWNQKDNQGKLVPTGLYVASGVYYKEDPAKKPAAKKNVVLTNMFWIVKK